MRVVPTGSALISGLHARDREATRCCSLATTVAWEPNDVNGAYNRSAQYGDGRNHLLHQGARFLIHSLIRE
jgi:hypothetical protein